MLKKKYYDGFIVYNILIKHLDKKKIMEVLTSFAESNGVNAVEVVRCKDCKYYREGECWCEHDNDCWEYYQSVIENPLPDDFCSRGERREK